MASRKYLENLSLVRLAVLCQQVAKDSAMEKNIADKAAKLHREWVDLVGREMYAPDFKTLGKIQKEKAALKTRMVALLTLV